MTNNGERQPKGVERVSAVPELLEGILLKVDMRTVLFAQRVSKTWKAVIAKSPPLQKKLFFRSATIDEAIRLNGESNEGVIIVRMKPYNFLTPRYIAVNPLLCRFPTVSSWWQVANRINVWNPTKTFPQSSASWWRMQIAHRHISPDEIEDPDKIDAREWPICFQGRSLHDGDKELWFTLKGDDAEETRTLAELIAIMEMQFKHELRALKMDVRELTIHMRGERVTRREFERAHAAERRSEARKKGQGVARRRTKHKWYKGLLKFKI